VRNAIGEVPLSARAARGVAVRLGTAMGRPIFRVERESLGAVTK
jgi:hypothetical protein